MSLIRCTNISKRFCQKEHVTDALHDVTLDVEEGEMIMISGPPSSGKTTLLSIMGGLLLPDSGECEVFSKETKKMNENERAQNRAENIGFVFQNLHLIPSLTAIENVLLPLEFVHVPAKAAKNHVNEIFYQLGINDKRNGYPDKLSQGENQLVALARALSNRPKLLLLDDPTSFLDHTTGMKIMTLLRQMVMCELVTVVLVTNDARLHPFAGRLVRMKGGQITSILGEPVNSSASNSFLKI